MNTSFQGGALASPLVVKSKSAPQNAVPNFHSGPPKALMPIPEAKEHVLIVIEHRGFVRNCIVSSLAGAVNFVSIGLGMPSVREFLARDEHLSAAIIVVCAIGGAEAETVSQLNQLAAARCTAPVVVMSDFDDAAFVISIMESGAKGFMPMDISLDLAAHTLRLVVAGGQYFPVNALMSAHRSTYETQRTAGRLQEIFTRRQVAVIDALRKGKANKVIAYELNMCESTVKVHVRNIMKKLNAKNRTEVAYLASELALGGAVPKG
jgi:DNA-binding NarL/FixJ family response regulator